MQNLKRCPIYLKKTHTFGIKTSPLGSCCNLYNELCKTSFHIFHECDHIKCLRSDLAQCFQNNLILPTFTHRVPFLSFFILQTINPFLKIIKFLVIILLILN